MSQTLQQRFYHYDREVEREREGGERRGERGGGEGEEREGEGGRQMDRG